MMNDKHKLKFYPFFVVTKWKGDFGGALIPCKTRAEAEKLVEDIFVRFKRRANDDTVWIAEAVIDQDGDLVFGENGAHGDTPMFGGAPVPWER